MTDKEIERTVKKLREFHDRLANDKEASKRFLMNAGIIDADGNRTKQYENLCIPQEPA